MFKLIALIGFCFQSNCLDRDLSSSYKLLQQGTNRMSISFQYQMFQIDSFLNISLEEAKLSDLEPEAAIVIRFLS